MGPFNFIQWGFKTRLNKVKVFGGPEEIYRAKLDKIWSQIPQGAFDVHMIMEDSLQGVISLTLYMIIGGVITSIAALVGTFLVGRDVTRQMKKYEEEGATSQDELARSLEYEKNSLGYNIKRLSWIYVVLGLVVLIVSISIAYYGK